MKGEFQMENSEKRSPDFKVKEYEELQDDGRQYYPFERLQLLNCAVQSEAKKGIIIEGTTGTGKTSVVRSFVQQDLETCLCLREGVKVIHLKEIFLRKIRNETDILENFSEMLEGFESSQFILYADLKNLGEFKKIVDVLDVYYEEIMRYNNLSFLKFMFEINTDSMAEYNELKKIARNDYFIISIAPCKEMDKLLDVLSIRADEMSRRFNISYSRDVLFYIVTIVKGLYESDEVYNLNNFLERIEYLFIWSKMQNRVSLERDGAIEVFKEQFEVLFKFPKEARLNTATHEAGHTLLKLVYKESSKIQYASVIPGNRFCGVMSVKDDRDIPNMVKTEEYFIYEIACTLAGRLSEKIIGKLEFPNVGAAGDLQRANSVLDRVICDLGFFKSIGENLVVNKNSLVSEKMKVDIEQEKKILLDKARTIASNALIEHGAFVTKLAEKLAEEWVVSGAEIYRMWEEYLKSKEESRE